MPGTLRLSNAIGISLVLLAALSLLAYWRSLTLPLISDDYLVIGLSREMGPVSQWGTLFSDSLYRNRATSMILTWWVYEAFGLQPPAYAVVNLAFHILNTWLLVAFGVFPRIGWWRAVLAAGFFAVYEGHQEAVIWFSALPELLVFFFGLAALWCWMRWVREGGQRWGWVALAAVAYVLALFSKESGVVMLPLFALTWWLERKAVDARRAALALLPLALVTVAYAALVFAGKMGNQHFHDGTFSLRAPFWLTMLNSTGRMFWVWGAVATGILLWLRPRPGRAWLAMGLVWIGLTLLPYSFLEYQTRVPSRHTYLPSAGVALVVAAGMAALYQQQRRLALALGALMVVHNCAYVATYKHAQYVRRAAPTEQLIELGRGATGPILLKSWPYTRAIAEYTMEIGVGKPREWLVFDGEDAGRAAHVYEWVGPI